MLKRRIGYWATGAAFVIAGFILGTKYELVYFGAVLQVVAFIAATLGLIFVKPTK